MLKTSRWCGIPGPGPETCVKGVGLQVPQHTYKHETLTSCHFKLSNFQVSNFRNTNFRIFRFLIVEFLTFGFQRFVCSGFRVFEFPSFRCSGFQAFELQVFVFLKPSKPDSYMMVVLAVASLEFSSRLWSLRPPLIDPIVLFRFVSISKDLQQSPKYEMWVFLLRN